MLVLSRRAGERLLIGDNIIVSIERVRGNTVRLGISAPSDVRVIREEVFERELFNTAPHVAEAATDAPA